MLACMGACVAVGWQVKFITYCTYTMGTSQAGLGSCLGVVPSYLLESSSWPGKSIPGAFLLFFIIRKARVQNGKSKQPIRVTANGRHCRIRYRINQYSAFMNYTRAKAGTITETPVRKAQGRLREGRLSIKAALLPPLCLGRSCSHCGTNGRVDRDRDRLLLQSSQWTGSTVICTVIRTELARLGAGEEWLERV